MNIPEKVVNFNAYDANGNRFLGLAETVTLPKFDSLSETMKGAGMAGEWASPTPGHFSAMTVELDFNTITETLTEVLSTSNTMITLRAAQQSFDSSAGAEQMSGLKIVIGGRPAGSDFGTLGVSAKSSSKATININYCKITLDTSTLLEWDLFNYIFIINDKDILGAVKNLI